MALTRAGIPQSDTDPFSDEFLVDPYPHYTSLREAGPVVYLSKYDVFAMARFQDVQAALRSPEVYCSGRGVGLADFSKEAPWRSPSLLLETDSPLHDNPRRIVDKIVSLSTLRDLRPQWSSVASDLAEHLCAKGNFDAVTELSEVFPLRVFPDALGIRKKGREHLLPYAQATFNAFGPRNALFHETQNAARASIRWVNESCQRRHLQPGGWGSKVHQSVELGECTEEQAERLVRSLLSAGVDTTVNSIANMMLAFCTYPEAWEALRKAPQLVKQSVEEALRWDSTVQTFFRTTTRSVDIAGVQIPEGAKVLLFLAAANRDPTRWPDPERFDIRRKPIGHVAFGSGVHQCLGQMVARMEMELILTEFLKRINSIFLTKPPQRRLNNTLHSLAMLPVHVEIT